MMMLKKILLPAVAALSLFSSSGIAADQWFYANVVFAGKTPDGVRLRLDVQGTDLVSGSTLFNVDSTMSNEILAMGMAGIASNKQGLIHTDLPDAVSSGTRAKIMAAYLTNRVAAQ